MNPETEAPAKVDGCGCDVTRMNRAQRRAHAKAGGPHKQQSPRLTFADDEITLTFGAPGQTFQVDTERRTISGMAVPYGEPTFSEGARFQFSQGVIQTPEDPSRIKLLVGHDRKAAVGYAIALDDTPDGLMAKFQVARGPRGDEALQMAEDRVWDGLSVGLRDGARFERREDVTHFTRAVLGEISLTPDPAFSSARVASVVAHVSERGTAPVKCSICGQEHAPGVTCPTTPAAPAFGATPTTPVSVSAPTVTEDPNAGPTAAAPATPEPAAPAAFDVAGLAAALAPLLTPAPVEPIAPVATFQVTEAPVYAFDTAHQLFVAGGQHEFSADIRAALYGDREAGERALGFVQQQFAVAQTNVQPALPAGRNRVGFVDRREYQYPLSAALSAGTLDNVAPFTWPKFNSLAGLVQDHTEGVEPTPGSVTIGSQTVNPKAMSGKVEITREVIDQNSSPQISNFIFQKMVRGYQEAGEGAIVTELTAQAANIPDITIPIGANASGPVLVNSLTGEVAKLQYVRGGYTFDLLATQIDLYTALATAQDSTGRNLVPVLNPQNAQGTASRLLTALDLAGIAAVPSWALGASSPNRQNSWLIDSESVSFWASAPQRLDFAFGASVQGGGTNLAQIAMITIGIWGYRAVAVTDFGGVRQVTYDGTGAES